MSYSTQTLDLGCGYQMRTIPSLDVSAAVTRSGRGIYNSNRSQIIRRWELGQRNLIWSELETLIDFFYLTAKGQENAFQMVDYGTRDANGDPVTRDVRFEVDEIDFLYLSPHPTEKGIYQVGSIPVREELFAE